jgi:multiple sugar transport system permease protein/raffinose/stachyose/melibiose transport system permease protein
VDELLGNRRAIAMLVGPALLIYTAVMLIPVFWSAGYSLSSGNAITLLT